MQFHIMACTYNSYGGHSTLCLISDFLLGNADAFGPAITELTVTFHFPTSGPPKSTLEGLFANFHTKRLALPKVVFRRKRGQAAIDIASELIDGRDWNRARGLSLPLFKAAVAETIAALELLRKKITKKDDFDLEAFLDHCNKMQLQLPSTEEELAMFAERRKDKQMARLAAMSSWERLDIEWRDFHPDARRILDDPFFWECSNDFAPNGNDTGADLFEYYREWLRRNPSGNPISFYQQLIRQWGISPESLNELERTVMDEAAVALAFAEFKLRAACSPEVASLARAAIRRQRQQANEAENWTHKAERLKSLEMLEAQLPNDV